VCVSVSVFVFSFVLINYLFLFFLFALFFSPFASNAHNYAHAHTLTLTHIHTYATHTHTTGLVSKVKSVMIHAVEKGIDWFYEPLLDIMYELLFSTSHAVLSHTRALNELNNNADNNNNNNSTNNNNNNKTNKKKNDERTSRAKLLRLIEKRLSKTESLLSTLDYLIFLLKYVNVQSSSHQSDDYQSQIVREKSSRCVSLIVQLYMYPGFSNLVLSLQNMRYIAQALALSSSLSVAKNTQSDTHSTEEQKKIAAMVNMETTFQKRVLNVISWILQSDNSRRNTKNNNPSTSTGSYLHGAKLLWEQQFNKSGDSKTADDPIRTNNANNMNTASNNTDTSDHSNDNLLHGIQQLASNKNSSVAMVAKDIVSIVRVYLQTRQRTKSTSEVPS